MHKWLPVISLVLHATTTRIWCTTHQYFFSPLLLFIFFFFLQVSADKYKCSLFRDWNHFNYNDQVIYVPAVSSNVYYYAKDVNKSKACMILSNGPFGGDGGNEWTDAAYSRYGNITRIRIRHGANVDRLEVWYGGVAAGAHGGSGGNEDEILFLPGEYIYRVDVRAGARIDQLTFYTNLRTLGPYGGNGGYAYSATGDYDYLKYFSGSSGSRVDQIVFHFHKCV